MSKVMDTVLTNSITKVPVIADSEIAGLEQRYTSMLGVENESKKRLAVQISKLRAARELSGASILDTRALRWRWSKVLRSWNTPRSAFSSGIPLPRLALLRTDHPSVRLEVIGRGGALRVRSGNDLPFPDVWVDNLKDVEVSLQRAYDWDRIGLRFKWDGVIPDEARDQIKEAQEKFGPDNVFLLTEAPADKWKLDQPPRPAVVDPLILGHRGGLLFYLGKFDPTEIEDYVSYEFTS